MLKLKSSLLFFLVFIFGISTASAADIILNEYNAVSASNFLNGGDKFFDRDDAQASDSYFDRVQGNGGDWFELVVITDHLNIQGWKLVINSSSTTQETLILDDEEDIWSDLRSGTIITISEDVADDISYDPLHGDWWINVQASTSGSGTYIENQNFPVNNDNWQLQIKTAYDVVKFGPAGEGISPVSGVTSEKIFRLEADPNASITPDSIYYDDGRSLSTFGSPNRWPGGNEQDFSQLRSAVPEPGTMLLLAIGGLKLLKRR